MAQLREIGWSAAPPQQSVAFGIPMAEALAEAVRRLSMDRVVVVTANSLARPGGLAEKVAAALGPKFHSMVSGIRPHSPRAEVIRVAEALKGAGGVVTIGGGSVCDTVKAARLCVANAIEEADDIDRLRPYNRVDDGSYGPVKSPTLPFVAIATALSASEFTSGAGITDERGPVKRVYVYPQLGPDIVILDPEMTVQTPPSLWFSTGMRAVDHAVETWCSINPNPLSDAYSLRAAQLLIVSLKQVFDDPNDMNARLDCMKGSWLSILGPASGGVKAGASHGIGHALGGTAGMSHGDTSCVMLPHVLRFNEEVNGARQAVIAAMIGEPSRRLGDIVGDLVAHLGLPGRLRDADISRDVLPAVADAAIHDSYVAANPRSISSVSEVRRILEDAW
ncbi:iron-containing alcohol dehydrogenase [Sphingobium sp. EM0848]|uniref:iron-containing alcohol dehydrogenase n=1 Tax=Sphingobium sp. EM0848 TaxID=2743473 RepID=UPI00159C95D7|nr:iron-containing alcohol dehydrogenase [Sphingobium sp. EM0848]